MKRLSCIVGSIALLMVASMQANGVVDEIAAAYCSGGGVGVIGANGLIGPPGLADDTKASFARPVLATGAVAINVFDPPLNIDIEIGDVPPAKFPAGTPVIVVVGGVFVDGLAASDADHPSTHCPGWADLP